MDVGFFAHNLHRAYPFVRGTVDLPNSASGSTSGTVLTLPSSAIVDCGFLLGTNAAFDPTVHSVYLNSVRRDGDLLIFEFASDAPELYGTPLTFRRDTRPAASISGSQPPSDEFVLEFSESNARDLSASSQSTSLSQEEACGEPLWSGFLVTGRLDELLELLPGDGSLTHLANAAVVEPALLQNLSRTFITQLGLANDDRTRVGAAIGCDEPTFAYTTGLTFVNAHCLTGDILFVAGFNCNLRQDTRANALILSAAIGAGAGAPCTTIPLFDGEKPPPGSSLLEGGERCNEVLRSINGLGGPSFQLSAGPGVTITPDPAGNKITIDVDMSGLALCDVSQSSQSV